MFKIKIVDSSQGTGGARVQDKAWQRLLLLDDGYLKDYDDHIEFFTSDGLMAIATKKHDSIFVPSHEKYLVDYCEMGLGVSVLEQNKNNLSEFVFSSTGYFDKIGERFFIKFITVKEVEDAQIPCNWWFENSHNIDALQKYLNQPIFPNPKGGDILIHNSNSDLIRFKSSYHRELTLRMHYYFNNEMHTDDFDWKYIYFKLVYTNIVEDSSEYRPLKLH